MNDFIRAGLILTLIGIPLYAGCRFLYKYRQYRKNKSLGNSKCIVTGQDAIREILMAFFAVAMIFLAAFTLQGDWIHRPETLWRTGMNRLKDWSGINLLPFKTIHMYFRYFEKNDLIFLGNLIGNIALFIPYGFGILLFWKRNRKPVRFILLCFILPLIIEGAQLFIGRSVDVDDILLNMLGAFLGGILFAIISRIFRVLRLFGR